MSTPNNGINGTLGNGLIGHWSFDNGSLLDESVNGRNLTMTGTVASVADKDGNENNAMDFDGASKLVTPFSDNILEPSISVWFKTSINDAPRRTLVNIRIVNTNAQGFGIYFLTNILSIITYTGEHVIVNDGSVAPCDGQWHNAVATYNKAQGFLKLYLDKKLIAIKVMTKDIVYLTFFEGIGIGATPSYAYPYYYNDAIDEVRIYNRPLTDGDITTVGETATGEVAELFDMGVNYAAKCKTPTANISGGSYTEAQIVELTCATPDAIIYYTINDIRTAIYSQPIEISENTTLKAIANAEGYDPSDILTENYIINKLEEIINEKYGNFFIATLKDKVNILNHKYYNLNIVENGLSFFDKVENVIYTDSFYNEPLFDSFFIEEDFTTLELFDNFDNKINNISIRKGYNCSEISFQSLHGLTYYAKLDGKVINIFYDKKISLNTTKYFLKNSSLEINQSYIFCKFNFSSGLNGKIQIVYLDDSVEKMVVESGIYNFKNVKKIINLDSNISNIDIINNSCFEFDDSIYIADAKIYFFANELDFVNKDSLDLSNIRFGKKYIDYEGFLEEHEDGNIELKNLNNSDVVYKDNDFINNENIPFVNFKIKAKKDDVFFKQNFKEISIKLEVI